MEHTTQIREEQPTTSACLMIQTISATNLEFMQGYSYVYGAEYETFTGAPLSAVHNRNVSCAVCYASTRVAVTMIPAKTQCPSTWTLEYSGYLMKKEETTSAPCMSVLTRTQTQCQAVLLIQMVPCFYMSKPIAMECCAHLTIHKKNLPVLFVYVIPWLAVQFGINCTSKVCNFTRRSRVKLLTLRV